MHLADAGDLHRPHARTRPVSNDWAMRRTKASLCSRSRGGREVPHGLGVAVDGSAMGSRSSARHGRSTSRSVTRVGPAASMGLSRAAVTLGPACSFAHR